MPPFKASSILRCDDGRLNPPEPGAEQGIHLAELTPGTFLEVQTENRRYVVVNTGFKHALISGHPEFCPFLRPATILGSSWGGTLLREAFIGRGMQLEFRHPGGKPITTSRILAIRRQSNSVPSSWL